MKPPKELDLNFIGSTSREMVETQLEYIAISAENRGWPLNPAGVRSHTWNRMYKIDPSIVEDEWGYEKMTRILNEMLGQDVRHL